jgi:hypothetical protein
MNRKQEEMSHAETAENTEKNITCFRMKKLQIFSSVNPVSSSESSERA